ncbi:hypothetical protein OG21DRAFT_1500313 [Imleria badia]|nr:hypothetical protein OG21DRAFT_1500313 [Imleria badia]
MCVLPAELIFKILCNSDPQDIIRWRRVSRWFCAITCNDLLWKTLYTDSPFPRPPGPSPSQSRASLEQMLVKSAQLAQSWTTRPMREVSSIKIKCKGTLPPSGPKLIPGRWLVQCEQARRFVLHDADPRSETHARKVLWEHEEPIVLAWDVHSVSPVAPGQSILYVFLLQLFTTVHNWKLLEFLLDDESGEIYDSATIYPPAWSSRTLPGARLHGGKSRFLFIRTEESMVFDTQSREFYVFPRLLDTQVQSFPQKWLDAANRLPFLVGFTDTHIIALDRRYDATHGDHDTTVIQIFTIPPDGSSVQEGKPVLCLTHQCFLDSRLLNVGFMKSRVDPITGDTIIRLADHGSSLADFKIVCYELMLLKPSGLEVSEVTICNRPAISVQIEGDYTECAFHVDVCGDMQLRGFYLGRRKGNSADPNGNRHVMKSRGFYWGQRKGKSVNLNESQDVMKFTIDMRRDPWAVVCSQIAPAEWGDAVALKAGSTWRRYYIVFDGLRGRLCYVDPASKDTIVVVEIE